MTVLIVLLKVACDKGRPITVRRLGKHKMEIDIYCLNCHSQSPQYIWYTEGMIEFTWKIEDLSDWKNPLCS